MFLATLAVYYVIVLGRQPLFITCPFCQLVWNLLLQTINLPPNECDSGTDLVESITLRLNAILIAQDYKLWVNFFFLHLCGIYGVKGIGASSDCRLNQL